MKHAPAAGSIARPVDQQLSSLPVYHGNRPDIIFIKSAILFFHFLQFTSQATDVFAHKVENTCLYFPPDSSAVLFLFYFTFVSLKGSRCWGILGIRVVLGARFLQGNLHHTFSHKRDNGSVMFDTTPISLSEQNSRNYADRVRDICENMGVCSLYILRPCFCLRMFQIKSVGFVYLSVCLLI